MPAARALCALAILLCALPSGATELRVDGEYRVRVAGNTDLLLDDQGTKLGQRLWAEQRFRLTPVIVEPDSVELRAQFDIFSGLFAGDLAQPFQGLGWTGRSQAEGLQATGFDFRAIFAQLKFPFGIVKLGQMPSEWGMGLVWNAGNESSTIDFGDQRFGDIVERVLIAARPFGFLGPRNPLALHTSLSLAADLVYSDRLAELLHRNAGGYQGGDDAFEALGALVYAPDEGTRLGFIAVRRTESFAQGGGDLHGWTFDLYARHAEPLEALDAVLSLEAEGAAFYGHSSHLQSLAAPASARLLQQGAAVRARLAFPQLDTELEGGYASGDANPFDDQSNGFSFNRDYKVSLVLWDEVMLFQTQSAAARLASPTLGARPPNGIDLLPTEGAVTNALYLKPTVRYRPAALRGKVRLTGALLWACAPQDVVDAYQSFLHIAPTNSFGAQPGRNYGVELDGAVSFRDRYFTDRLGLEVGVQGGVLFPGDAFDKPGGERMGKAVALKLRAGLEF